MHSPTVSNSPDVENFWLIHGGTIHDIRVRLKLAARDPKRYARHVVVAVAITWLPLLILSIFQGLAWGNAVKMPFLLDYSTNVRILITLPLLILAESLIDPHVREAVHHFLTARLVTGDQLLEFENVIRKTMRLRDNWVVTLALFVLAYGPAVWNSGELVAHVDGSSWHFINSGDGQRISWAGLWFAIVSIPIFRLIVFRWLWLLILWTIFLWRVTQLRLNCTASHPDRAGGLGFLTHTQLFFGIVTFAMSASVAGSFANQLAYEGSSLQKLQFMMAAFCLLAIAFTVAPLIVVSPFLFRVRQRGIFAYSSLGVKYTEEFESKWLSGGHGANAELMGSADIQSLADLGNSFGVIDEMKVFLIDHEILLKLAMPAVAPMLVLIATILPAEEIFKAILRLLE